MPVALALFVCGSSPAWFVSDSLGLMKFYAVYIHQPLIFEWVKANLFICHSHYLFSPLKCWFETGQMAEWHLTSVNYWLVRQYYVQFLQQIKMQNKKFMCCGACKFFLFVQAFGNRRFFSPCTSDFTWILLFRKEGHTVVSFADG